MNHAGWPHRACQSASSHRSPLCLAHGGVPGNVPSGILTWGQCAYYTKVILVFNEEPLWLNSSCSVAGRNHRCYRMRLRWEDWYGWACKGGEGIMSEIRTAILFKKGSPRSSEDEWLGAESHMPNLNQDLRRREPRRIGFSSGWIVGVMFAAGVAAGCLAMRLVDRRS